MTTPQTPVAAHLRLVEEYTRSTHTTCVALDDFWPRQERLKKAVEASARALAAMPAEPVLVMHPDDPMLAGVPDGTHVILQRNAVPFEKPIAQQAGGVPAGFVLAPADPDEGMVKAGNRLTWPYPSAQVYRDMLAAAPSPSAVQPTAFQPGEYERMTASGWNAWSGIDPQELSGTVQPLSEAQRAPLTDAQLINAWDGFSWLREQQRGFIRGARFAERYHGIVTKESST